MGDSFNESSSGEQGAVDAHKSCIDVETPSENLGEQPVRRSSRIRRSLEPLWLQSVADTGWFGGGDAISICNEPNASQDHIA